MWSSRIDVPVGRWKGHAEIDQLWPTVGPSLAEAVELGGDGVEADLESFDFAEPTVVTCSADALAEVVGGFVELAVLAWVDLGYGAAVGPALACMVLYPRLRWLSTGDQRATSSEQ